MAVLRSIDKLARRDNQGALAEVTDHEVLAQRLENALLTERGEIPMRPDYGSRLRSLLWEFRDDLTAQTIKSEIRKTARKDVPKVSIKRIDIKRPKNFQYGFLATIWIGSPSLSIPDSYKVNFEMGE